MSTTTHTGGRKHPLAAYYAYSASALAGLLFGMDIGAISGANQFIQREFRVSDSKIERIVSAMLSGPSPSRSSIVGAENRSFTSGLRPCRRRSAWWAPCSMPA